MSIPVEFDTLKSMIQSLVAQARANEAGSNGGVVPNTYHPNTETYAIGCPPSDYETMFSKMGTVRDGTIVTVTNYGNLINMLVACGTGRFQPSAGQWHHTDQRTDPQQLSHTIEW